MKDVNILIEVFHRTIEALKVPGKEDIRRYD